MVGIFLSFKSCWHSKLAKNKRTLKLVIVLERGCNTIINVNEFRNQSKYLRVYNRVKKSRVCGATI